MNPVATPADLTRSDARSTAADLSVAVVGMGYVGLPTAIALGVAGHPVIGLDISERRLDGDRRAATRSCSTTSRSSSPGSSTPSTLALTADPAELAAADAIIIARPDAGRRAPPAGPAPAARRLRHGRRPRPRGPDDHPHLDDVDRLDPPDCSSSRSPAAASIAGEDVFVAFAPERIDPGVKAHAQQATPRVVGGVTEECFKHAASVLRHTCSAIHAVSSAEAAEMAKLMENTFRATNIALAFEFAEAARIYGLDAVEVIDAAATKPYAFMAHYPSAGVGGHCIPVDPYYLLEPLRADGVHMPVIAASMEQVAKRPGRVRPARPGRGRAASTTRACSSSASPTSRASPTCASRPPWRSSATSTWPACTSTTTTRWPAPSSRTGSASSPSPPSAEGYDVAILTLVHPGQDLSWLHDCPVVIDGTYRTPVGTRREVI